MKWLSVLSFVLASTAVLLWFAAPEGAGSSDRDAPPPVSLQASPAADETGELAELRRLTEDLVLRIETLESRQRALENAGPVMTARAPVETETEAKLEEMMELAASIQNPNQPPPPRFEELVLGVIEGNEERERAEREQARRDFAIERVNERVTELTQALGLTTVQADDMRNALTDHQLRRDEIFTSMREDGIFDREAVRDGMEELRTETLSSIERFLAPDQYDRYVEMEEERRGGGGFGGFGGRGGGGGGFGGRGGGGGGGGGRGGDGARY